jgi:hypothetical protein
MSASFVNTLDLNIPAVDLVRYKEIADRYMPGSARVRLPVLDQRYSLHVVLKQLDVGCSLEPP